MKYRTLGRTGLKVSEIGLGGWAIGGVAFDDEGRPRGYGAQPKEQSIATLRRAVDLGINFFDTGAYGAHKGEEYTGEALSGVRDKVIIQAKGGTYYQGTHRGRDFTERGLRWQLEETLRRLRTDYVDCYVLHEPSEQEAEEGYPTLIKFKEEGKARFIGISPFPGVEMAERYLKSGQVDVLTQTFNVLNPHRGLAILELARRYNAGVIVMQPLAAGFLTGTITPDTQFAPDDYRSTWPRERVRSLAERAERLLPLVDGDRRRLPEFALRYILSFPEVSTVIAGAKSVPEVEQNASVSDGVLLSEEVLAKIRHLQERNFDIPA